LENIKVKELKFLLAGNSLAELKREFGKDNDELAKIAKLKKIE